MRKWNDLADYMERVMCGQKGVPGCDIQVMQEHRVLYRHTCGYADRAAKTPLSPDQLYYMYSCTKPMTVTAGLRLWEEGKLDLEAPVSDYLPAFTNLKKLSPDGLVPVQNPLKVKHLFTMTGGYDYQMTLSPVAERIAEGHTSTREIVDAFAERALLREPGEKFQYSICHDILAAVIEEIAGMPFSAYMEKILFLPLGMTDSHFHETPAIRERLASQYLSMNGIVSDFPKENDFYITPEYESGGAGLISSLHDYAVFADAMACDGQAANGYRIVKPETVKFLRTEQLSSFAVDSAFSCAAGPGYGYGLGVRTRISHEGGLSSLGEFGWDGAAGSYVMMDTEKKLSIFFAMHVRNWPDCIGLDHGVLRDMVYELIG